MPPTPAHDQLQRYVTSVAAEWELAVGDQLWREVEGSLCFIDISGFTKLAERLSAFGRIGAEELTDVLDRVFSSMIALAYERGAVQLKFGGDALLLLFTGPDHGPQAASAAVEMRAALREAARWTTSVGPLRLRMSVGIHSGTVHLFRVGASHLELLISGSVATVTTEMEATADAGEIVVSSVTRDLLPAGAAPAAKGNGWVLRWRRTTIEPCGFIPRRAVGTESLLANIPLALREHLRLGPTEPEHRAATVAFVKFSGVDDLMASRGPAEVAIALDQVVREVQRAADAEGVTFLATDLDANGGKIILATGVPAALEDDAGRMLRALRRLASAELALPIRMGVNRGHVFAGDIGNRERRATYTVMGDTVNIAARLMAAAPPGAVYAMPDVLDDSRTIFETTALEPLVVKGKAAPLLAVAVGEEIGSRSDGMRVELPFVGRRDDLASLARSVEAVAGGSGGVVKVVGAAGIGKSRLVHEAASTMPSVTTVTVAGEPLRSATPYRPFRDTLRAMLGLVRGDAATMARQLEHRITDLAPDLLPLLPLIGDVTHVDVDITPEVSAIEPQFLPERVADVVIELLGLLVPGPLVLVAEDAHWMDEPTTLLLERLAVATASNPWLVIAVRRPDSTGFDPAVGHTITLEPLERADAESLVVAATEGSPLRPHDVAHVVDRAAGNPLFLEEILRAVRDLGSIDALPDSLGAIVNAQIDGLPPTPRKLLRCAAVLGSNFRRSVLDDLLLDEGIEPDEANWRHLDAFIEVDIDDRLRFRHAVLRDTAYESLPYRRRRDLHRRAGEAIERAANGSPETVADLLALHYAHALDHDRAWQFGRLAGDRAREAFANTEAATNYELALDSARRLPSVPTGDRAEIWTVLGDVREQAGLFGEALEAYRRASSLRRDDVIETAELLLRRARSNERAGAYGAALRETAIAHRLIEQSPDVRAGALGARLLAFRAVVRQAQEHPREALRAARRAVDAATSADEPSALARAYGVLDWAHLMTGRPDLAVHGSEALRIYEELGDLSGQAVVTGNLGAQAYFDGRWTDAVDLYERSRRAFLQTGNAVQAAITGANVGEVLVSQHRLTEAEPVLRDAARVLRASNFADGATFAEIQLARLLCERGDLDDAVRLLVAVHDELAALRMFGSALEAAVHLADCRRLLGDPGSALDLLAEAEARAGDEAELLAAQVARVRTLALLDQGDPAEALATVTVGIDTVRAQGLDYEMVLLLNAKLQVLDALEQDPDDDDLRQIAQVTTALALDSGPVRSR